MELVMIFPPGNPDDPAYWAAVFAGHVAVGVVLAAVAIWTGLPVWVAPLGYLVLWEGAVQRFGAGLWDAAVDTWAVALGAAMAFGLRAPDDAVLAAGIGLALVSVWAGIGRRKWPRGQQHGDDL